MSNFSLFSRHLVCFNQGEYIQYVLLAAERHKSLRTIVNKKSRNRRVEDVVAARSELEQFLNRKLKGAALKIFRMLKDEYFNGRHHVLPRICIKIPKPTEKGVYITLLVRDAYTPYASDYPLGLSEKDPHGANTVFKNIYQDGKFCMFNDIPYAVANGHYKSARISRTEAETYVKLRKDEQDRRTDGAKKDKKWKDEKWIACWHMLTDNDGIAIPTNDYTWFYKSTLVVPMTLWGNADADQFDGDFIATLNDKLDKKRNSTLNEAAHGVDIGRFIFGFLCFDHVDINFFQDEDVNVGYMAADWLSLYMITRLQLTTWSEIYRRAITFR